MSPVPSTASRSAENLCLVGPAGTGKSHVLVVLSHAAVAEGMRVRYFAAADLGDYRGLADNSVAKIIDALLRHWPFDAWSRFLPEHTTDASLLDRLLHHAVVVVIEGDSYRMRKARQRGGGGRKKR